MNLASTAPTPGPGDLSSGEITRLRDRLIVECANHAAQANDYRVAVDELAGRQDVRSHLEREVAQRVIRQSNEAVIDIFNALLRIDAGTYGMCVQCGGPIPPDRLDANPRERCCPSCPEVDSERHNRTYASRSW